MSLLAEIQVRMQQVQVQVQVVRSDIHAGFMPSTA